MTFVADSIIEYLEVDQSERVLCVLPLSFGYGLYQLLTSVRSGALVLEPGFAFAGRVVSLIGDQRITALPGVPTVFGVLLSLRGLEEREFPELRTLTNAGAPMPEPMIQSLPRPSPTRASTRCTDRPRRSGSVTCRPTSSSSSDLGRGPDPGHRGLDRGRRRPRPVPGAVGELMVRRTHVMLEYWNKRGDSEKLRPGRWPWERVLATGDLFGPTRRATCTSSAGATTSSSRAARRWSRRRSRTCCTPSRRFARQRWSGSPTSCSARR